MILTFHQRFATLFRGRNIENSGSLLRAPDTIGASRQNIFVTTMDVDIRTIGTIVLDGEHCNRGRAIPVHVDDSCHGHVFQAYLGRTLVPSRILV